jgi:predicted AAA+ superfamily ATPase
MIMVLARSIVKEMKVISTMYPIIALTGARQSGKSTLLKDLYPDYRYLNFKDPDLLQYFNRDPRSFLKEFDKFCIFDEAQRVPDLFSYLQGIVDSSKIMGQFILSGSQNFLLLKSINQSLAGRVAIFKLFPFDFTELKSANLLSSNYIEAMLNGFYPAIFDRKIPSSVFYNNYMQTYVERDILDLVSIRDLKSFRSFVQIVASRAGQTINYTKLANDSNISSQTVRSWLSLLESSYIIFMLQPLHNNFEKRVVKSPKLYFYDTGLLCNLLKLKNEKQVNNLAFKGSLFENMMIAEMVKHNHHNNLMQDFWYWRNSDGVEVDLIIQDDYLYDLFEVKSTTTVKTELFKGLEYFSRIANEDVKSKTLIYAGLENQNRTFAKVTSWYNINDNASKF